MNVPVCDICGNIAHRKRYAFIIIPIDNEDSIEDMMKSPRDYFQHRHEQRQELEKNAKEICTGCKELYDKVTALREKEAKKLKKASDAILKSFFNL